MSLPNPRLVDVCGQSGRLEGIASGVCPRRSDDWEWDAEMTILGVLPEHSALPSCALAEERDLAGLDVPGWRLRVEKVLGPGLAGRSTDHYHTVIVAARLDVAKPCGVRLIWKLKQHTVKLAPGTVIRYAQRYTIRTVEDDVTVTAVLRDDKGAFLLAHTTGARPEVWDSDMWPELSLSIDPSSICADARFPAVQRLRFTLTGGRDQCSLDASSARCCSFGGDVHLVLATDAVRTTPARGGASGGDKPVVNISVVVARQGVLAYVPP